MNEKVDEDAVDQPPADNGHAGGYAESTHVECGHIGDNRCGVSTPVATSNATLTSQQQFELELLRQRREHESRNPHERSTQSNENAYHPGTPPPKNGTPRGSNDKLKDSSANEYPMDLQAKSAHNVPNSAPHANVLLCEPNGNPQQRIKTPNSIEGATTELRRMTASQDHPNGGKDVSIKESSTNDQQAGTPLYMAPELLEEKPYDHQADFWSLGCIVYESLSSHPPFCTNSILHLVSLIRHEEVKWPSFLSSDCVSFLQGLLEKDAQLRMTWAQILYHPFVEGHIIFANDRSKSSCIIPKFTVESVKLVTKVVAEIQNLSLVTSEDNATCSRDSVKAILESDLENIETDIEETIEIPFVNECILSDKVNINESNKIQELPFRLSGNSNLLVSYFKDNFISNGGTQRDSIKLCLNLKKTSVPSSPDKVKIDRSKDLEKRKLSQNLNNFSLRLGQTAENEKIKKISENINDIHKQFRGSLDEDNPSSENSPPCLLPGWDSCDESQSPPIENEEWLAFLHRSMQEILDGELDSLKQQNLVSIIVAPLRNTKASSKVIECVAQLLSLPFILGGSVEILECIKCVYVGVKLVPNLVYASKLIMSNKSSTESESSISIQNCKSLGELPSEKIKTICSIYELVCYLVHLNERFLFQFCDSIAILAAHELLIKFLSHDLTNPLAARITNCVLALLCCVLREVPENAKLVERIVFHSKVDFVLLTKNKSTLLRTRICMLFRLLGRFSCRGLQSIWTANIRQTMEALMHDSSAQVRTEAESVLGELKQFSFYS